MRHRDRRQPHSAGVPENQQSAGIKCLVAGPESVSCRVSVSAKKRHIGGRVLAGKALCRRTVALGDPPIGTQTLVGYDSGDGRWCGHRNARDATPAPPPGTAGRCCSHRSTPPSASPGLPPGHAEILGLARCTWFYKRPRRAAKVWRVAIESRRVRDGRPPHAKIKGDIFLAAALPVMPGNAPLPGMCFAFP
jgi:hypothetical protein